MFELIAFLLATQEPPRIEQTIVVTAERIEQPWRESTAAVTVLKNDDLRGETLGDALERVPGLQLLQVNPGAHPMISSRGFFGAGEVEYVQLLVDGVPAADVESGLGDWRSISLESIDRVEVLRGAGSSLFGDTALGGVVQVFRKPSTRVGFSAGSFDSMRSNAAWASDAFSVDATYARSDGFRDHGAYDELFAHVTFGGLSLDASQKEREDPGARSAEEMASDPFGSNEIFAGDREKSRRVRVSFRHRDLVLYAHRRDSEQTRTLLLAPGFSELSTRDLDTYGAGANSTRTFEFAHGRAIGGVEASYGSADRVDRVQTAAFVSGEWRAATRVRLAAGARWDAINDNETEHALSPRIGASFDLGTVTSYIQLSRAFKAPTLDQRFDRRTVGGFTISNPELRSQHSKNIEVGVRGAWWEVVGYHTDVDDEIDFDIRTFRYGNIGHSRHRGIEAMARGRFASLAYTWTRVRGESRHQLKNIAEHVARAGFDVRSFADFHLEIEHSANRWLDDANEFPLDDATVVDLRVAKTLGAITAAVEANNLFDRRYAPLGFALGDAPYYYPAAGRSIALSITWKGEPLCPDCSSPSPHSP